jgi:hypothetical protein
MDTRDIEGKQPSSRKARHLRLEVEPIRDLVLYPQTTENKDETSTTFQDAG